MTLLFQGQCRCLHSRADVLLSEDVHPVKTDTVSTLIRLDSSNRDLGVNLSPSPLSINVQSKIECSACCLNGGFSLWHSCVVDEM